MFHELCKPDVGVNTIVNISADNAWKVNDVTIKITGKDLKLKMPTTAIFPEAAPGSFFHVTVSWENFQFRPNELTSAYINNEDFLKMEVSKTNNKAEGKFIQEKVFASLEEEGANVRNWCLRATVCPTKSAFKTQLVISALPMATIDFARTLRGRVEAPGYPNIHVKVLDAFHNGKNEEQHGLPMFPLIMHSEREELDLSEDADWEMASDNIVEAVTAFWSGASQCVHLPIAEFNAMIPAGEGQPIHDNIPCQLVFGVPQDSGRRAKKPREGRFL